jgi:hypothetical protein
VGLKKNGTHQLVYTDDINLLGDNIDIIKKNTEIVINASKKVGLKINADKAKYKFMSRHQNAGQNRDIQIASRYFKNVALFKYFGTNVTNQNFVQKQTRGV